MKRTLVRIAVGAAATLAVAAGAAYATGLDSAQVIQACQGKNGSLRVVAAAADCKDGDSPISWNTQGPQGPPGPAGGPPALHTQVVGTATLAGVNGGNPFTIRGFSWGASNDGAGAGGGGAGGKATIGEVELVRGVDALSSHLVDDAAAGLHLSSAVVDLFVPGTQSPYARYTLDDVRVAKVVHDGDVETLALASATIDEQSLAGAAPPQLPAGSQLGDLQLDGLAAPLGVSGDRFEIDSASAPVGGGSGNAPTIHPLVVSLAHGAASPQLVHDVLTGLHLRAATLTTPHATYSLTDVVVQSVQDEATGAAGSIPSEKIELVAAHLAVTSQ
jgi:type VI protein secretion system component Hcp